MDADSWKLPCELKYNAVANSVGEVVVEFCFFDWLRKKKKGANDLLSVFRAKESLSALSYGCAYRVELYSRFEEQWRQFSYLPEDCCGSLGGDS